MCKSLGGAWKSTWHDAQQVMGKRARQCLKPWLFEDVPSMETRDIGDRFGVNVYQGAMFRTFGTLWGYVLYAPRFPSDSAGHMSLIWFTSLALVFYVYLRHKFFMFLGEVVSVGFVVCGLLACCCAVSPVMVVPYVYAKFSPGFPNV